MSTPRADSGDVRFPGRVPDIETSRRQLPGKAPKDLDQGPEVEEPKKAARRGDAHEFLPATARSPARRASSVAPSAERPRARGQEWRTVGARGTIWAAGFDPARYCPRLDGPPRRSATEATGDPRARHDTGRCANPMTACHHRRRPKGGWGSRCSLVASCSAAGRVAPVVSFAVRRLQPTDVSVRPRVEDVQ